MSATFNRSNLDNRRKYGLNCVHSQQKLSDDIGIHFLINLVNFQTLRNIHLRVQFGVPVINLFTLIICGLNTNKERNSTVFLSQISRDGPIEMHNGIIRFIDSDIISNITSEFSIRSFIVDIYLHRRHIMVIPISRAIKRNSLDVMIVLNRNSSQLSRNSNLSIAVDDNMRLCSRRGSQSCVTLLRQNV